MLDRFAWKLLFSVFLTLLFTALITLVFCKPAFAQANNVSQNPLYTTIEVRLPDQQLRLYWADEKAQVFKSFDKLDAWLRRSGKRLVFAMNAGMYHYDFSPVGLLQIDGVVLKPINTDAGFGNFFLKPNGIFLWNEREAFVVETSEYARFASKAKYATQSGPLLLKDFKIHARFDPTSSSRHIRNGVGVKGERVYLTISNQAVSFYEFARYFRDELGCSDALYLDGSISSIYSHQLQRKDQKAELGPMLAITVDTDH